MAQQRRERPEWASSDPFARRRELYQRAAPVFRQHGYRGSTLKALAAACGLSIPALYRYFPSKRALALFPLATLYPELHPPGPDLLTGDPAGHVEFWIDNAVAEAPLYLLAATLLHEVGLTDDERRRSVESLNEHIALVGAVVQRAAPHLTDATARDVVSTMINVAFGPALTGIDREPDNLRRELRSLLRGYGVVLG